MVSTWARLWCHSCPALSQCFRSARDISALARECLPGTNRKRKLPLLGEHLAQSPHRCPMGLAH